MINWMAAFLTTGLNIALPKNIQDEFDLDPVALGWVPLCYILAMAVVMVPFGKIADMKGRRLVFASGLWILFVSIVALIFVRSYTTLIDLPFVVGRRQRPVLRQRDGDRRPGVPAQTERLRHGHHGHDGLRRAGLRGRCSAA